MICNDLDCYFAGEHRHGRRCTRGCICGKRALTSEALTARERSAQADNETPAACYRLKGGEYILNGDHYVKEGIVAGTAQIFRGEPGISATRTYCTNPGEHGTNCEHPGYAPSSARYKARVLGELVPEPTLIDIRPLPQLPLYPSIHLDDSPSDRTRREQVWIEDFNLALIAINERLSA